MGKTITCVALVITGCYGQSIKQTYSVKDTQVGSVWLAHAQFGDSVDFVDSWLTNVEYLGVSDECVQSPYDYEVWFSTSVRAMEQVAPCTIDDCAPLGRVVFDGPDKAIWLVDTGYHFTSQGTPFHVSGRGLVRTSTHEAAHVAYKCMGVPTKDHHKKMGNFSIINHR